MSLGGTDQNQIQAEFDLRRPEMSLLPYLAMMRCKSSHNYGVVIRS